ncbi:hypothetical protein GYB22_07345 [bacterium]|nr:hypothetical protein [bacterium]
MGLYLLNISVDTADLNSDSVSEDLSINDQESIVEIVVEKILGFENAIKEYDDHDSEDQNKKKNVNIDFLFYGGVIRNNSHNELNKGNKLYSEYGGRLTKGFKEIDCPPPKV